MLTVGIIMVLLLVIIAVLLFIQLVVMGNIANEIITGLNFLIKEVKNGTSKSSKG